MYIGIPSAQLLKAVPGADRIQRYTVAAVFVGDGGSFEIRRVSRNKPRTLVIINVVYPKV